MSVDSEQFFCEFSLSLKNHQALKFCWLWLIMHANMLFIIIEFGSASNEITVTVLRDYSGQRFTTIATEWNRLKNCHYNWSPGVKDTADSNLLEKRSVPCSTQNQRKANCIQDSKFILFTQRIKTYFVYRITFLKMKI